MADRLLNTLHMKRLVFTAACILAMPGCYFGRTPTAKTLAYAGNGALVAVGAIGTSARSGNEERNASRMIGVTALAAGVLGIALNLATETEHPAAAPTAHVANGDAASITY